MDFLANKSKPKRASREVDRAREIVRAAVGRVDPKIRERVRRAAPLEERATRERVTDRPRRPRGVLADARGHDRKRRIEPARHPRSPHEGALRDAEEEAAARRDDEPPPAFQGTQSVPFQLAEASFPRGAKDRLDRAPLGGLDERIGVRELPPEARRERSPRGRFADSMKPTR
jgi:hypothetical protein